jgi:hypothetical protein
LEDASLQSVWGTALTRIVLTARWPGASGTLVLLIT